MVFGFQKGYDDSFHGFWQTTIMPWVLVSFKRLLKIVFMGFGFRRLPKKFSWVLSQKVTDNSSDGFHATTPLPFTGGGRRESCVSLQLHNFLFICLQKTFWLAFYISTFYTTSQLSLYLSLENIARSWSALYQHFLQLHNFLSYVYINHSIIVISTLNINILCNFATFSL